MFENFPSEENVPPISKTPVWVQTFIREHGRQAFAVCQEYTVAPPKETYGHVADDMANQFATEKKPYPQEQMWE